jgi:hypothetical protein
MSFAETTKSYSETRTRTASDYVKFSPEYRVVLRILDEKAKLSWKHWIREANKSEDGTARGMFATCPNITAQTKVCPIEDMLKGLEKDDPTYMDKRAKKRFLVNVLDRTPYTVCGACNEQTPSATGKKCINCEADVKKNDFVPLNKIKILEGGPQLFATTLNAVETMGLEDWEKNITEYDITFQTQGTGRDRKIAAIPQQPSELSESDFIDPETQEPQKRFDLELLSEPNTVEEIHLLLEGAGIAQLNELRGITA